VKRALGTEATCRYQSSRGTVHWSELKHYNCPENEVREVPSTSDANLTTSDGGVVSDTSSHLLLLVNVIFMSLLLICCSILAIIYCRKRPGTLASPGGDKPEHIGTSSDQKDQYDYISSSDMYSLPELPSRPTEANYEKPDLLQANTSLYSDNSCYQQSGVLQNAEVLVESDFCGAKKSCVY
jgi:hypothetical protein